MEHEYDPETSRLIRSVISREPRFTEQDRAELLALAAYRDGLCPRCGRPIEVCTAHEETGPTFDAEYTMCRATAALLPLRAAKEKTSDNKPNPNFPAYIFGTTIRKIRKG